MGLRRRRCFYIPNETVSIRKINRKYIVMNNINLITWFVFFLVLLFLKIHFFFLRFLTKIQPDGWWVFFFFLDSLNKKKIKNTRTLHEALVEKMASGPIPDSALYHLAPPPSTNYRSYAI